MEPLASTIRPKTFDEYVGQAHLVGIGAPLRVAAEQKHLFSFVLWGPPGVGKTSLAIIYAHALDAEFFQLSAVSAGKDDIRKIIASDSGGRPKLLFLDEIHRFNKAQQDFLLPYVERGEVTLVGATTENPSFEVIPALLSRCRVFVLNELTAEDVKKITARAAGALGVSIDAQSDEFLVNIANGDGRQVVTVLENTVRLYKDVTVATLTKTLQSKQLRFDKGGEEHYNTTSAFIKSMRASNVDAALYYLARMVEAGEDAKFIARRMVVFASEDVGIAQPTALVVANAVFSACETIGYPECAINLAHGVTYLCMATKSRQSYDAYQAAVADVQARGNLPIPLKLRNAVTKLMKDVGYGKGYEKYTDEDLLPIELKGKKYFTDRGDKKN